MTEADRDQIWYSQIYSNEKARQLRTTSFCPICQHVSEPYGCFTKLAKNTDMAGPLLYGGSRQQQPLIIPDSSLALARGKVVGVYLPRLAANFDPLLVAYTLCIIFLPVRLRAIVFTRTWHQYRVPLQNGRRIGGSKGQSESESRDANLHCEECDASSLEWVTPRGIKSVWSLSWKLGIEGK